MDDSRIGTLGANPVPFPPADFFPGGKSVLELDGAVDKAGVPVDSVVADEAASGNTCELNRTQV